MYNKEKHIRENNKMMTRCFERTSYNRYTGKDVYEVINISDYGFEWYVDNNHVRSGLVENLEEDIQSLIDEGFEEVV